MVWSWNMHPNVSNLHLRGMFAWLHISCSVFGALVNSNQYSGMSTEHTSTTTALDDYHATRQSTDSSGDHGE